MTNEFKKLKTNLKLAINIARLLSRALSVPKLALEKMFIPAFKKIYCSDICNLLIYIRGDDESSSKSFRERLTPTLEKKIVRLEKELVQMYDKISSIVLRKDDIQQLKRSCSEVSVVLMVAYFEDFLKENFVINLNKNPKRALPFAEKQLRIADLKEFGFNLNKKMGSVIAEKINFQNLEESAKVYKLSLRIDIFNKNALWKKKIIEFFQIRHLIIHNNGKIDMGYVKIVKCSRHELGKKIELSEDDLIQFKKVLLKIAEHIQKQLD